MFDELISAAIRGGAAGATAGYVNRRMQSARQLIWSGECGDANGTVLTIEQVLVHGRVMYELAVTGAGLCVSAGRYPTYGLCYAVVQQWEHYLRSGGTVKAWTEQGQDGPTELVTREARAT